MLVLVHVHDPETVPEGGNVEKRSPTKWRPDRYVLVTPRGRIVHEHVHVTRVRGRAEPQ